MWNSYIILTKQKTVSLSTSMRNKIIVMWDKFTFTRNVTIMRNKVSLKIKNKDNKEKFSGDGSCNCDT